MAGEFDLIDTYFKRPVRHARLGGGDDCALIAPASGIELAVSTDMLVEGTHFLPGTGALRLGHKTLAVNLSDLAAMGAAPRYATLALALPSVDEAWLAGFARGFFALAEQYGVELIGGDTTRGPLTLCVTVFGEVPAGQAVKRSGAQAGDDIWVSGTLGDAALGLAHLKGEVTLAPAQADYAVTRLEAPTPQIALGLALRGTATAMIDLSDGLAGDVGHIAKASGLDAQVQAASLPQAPLLAAHWASLPPAGRLRLCAAGGDDYELCFTAALAHRAQVEAVAAQCGVRVTNIGSMTAPRGAAGAVLVMDASGNPCLPTVSGFDHFKEPA